MKLSISSRGWKELNWKKLCNVASEMNFSGVEPYNLHRLPELVGGDGAFSIYNAKATARRIKEKRLSVACIDSSVELSTDNYDEKSLKLLIDIAAEMGCPFVGVRPESGNLALIKSRIDELLPYLEARGITLLIKTSGQFADTAKLRGFLDSYARDSIGALWEIDKPFLFNCEQPETTVENLGAYIKHVHVRDVDESGHHTIIGEGRLPIDDIIRALSSVAYEGFLSLVWKPEWESGLADWQVVFPYYISYMGRFIGESRRKKLYLNFDGSGEYIWKKDELVDLTFSEVLDRVVEEFPNQYAFKYTTLNYTRTYEEFRRDVDDFARALISLGVRPGNKVAIWATNVPEWFISFWATTKIGAVLVSVNTAYKTAEIEYLLRQSDTHTLIMIEAGKDSNYCESMRELCPELESSEGGKPLHCESLPFLRNIITVGFKMKGGIEFGEAMARKNMVPLAEVRMYASRVKPSDVCNMQYTSGTTGFPKGVMLTHHSVVNNGKCIGDRMGLSTADRMMIQVPMFHCFGMVLSMTASVTHAVTMCPMPYFSAKNSLACINLEKITCFNGVPTMFISMFNHADYKRTDFSHMRTGIMAGAGCPPELMKRAALPDEMNMRGIVSVYGQTESSPGSTMSAWEDSLEVRTETVGYAFPHVLCKIVDPETGAELDDGENGEFCSKGYNLMKGYYKMPRATKDAIDADGWLHSGDLARRTPEGNYLITGRIKDMIIRGGENIYPKEIEDYLCLHEEIYDVAVVGIPDKTYGEEAVACVCLQNGSELTEEDIKKIAAKGLAAHKIPRYIIFLDSLPVNAAGKVLKYKLREQMAERFCD